MIGVAGGCVSLKDGTPPSTPSRRSNVNFPRLPSQAPEILAKNTIYLKDIRSVLSLHDVEQRRKFQSLVRRYIGQILYGCQEPQCTTPTCLSFRRRVADVPLRKFTALSARTVACFLANDEDPEKALCPHEPAVAHKTQATTEDLSHHQQRKPTVRSTSREKDRTNSSLSKAGLTTSVTHPEFAGRGEKAVGQVGKSGEGIIIHKTKLDGSALQESRHGDKDEEVSAEKREKDTKSFTQNLFDTLAVRMLEWLPVPSLMTIPDFNVEQQENGDPSAAASPAEVNPKTKMTEQGDKSDTYKPRGTDDLDLKPKPRSHSVTTRLRLNSDSIPHLASLPGARRVSKQRALSVNDEIKQDSQQQSRQEILRHQQGPRDKAAQLSAYAKSFDLAEETIDHLEPQAEIAYGQCSTVSGLPGSAKTWGQLKAWVTQNQDSAHACCEDDGGASQKVQDLSEPILQQSDPINSSSGASEFFNADPDPTLIFDIPVGQTLATELRTVSLSMRNGHAHACLRAPAATGTEAPRTDPLGGPESSGSSIASLPPKGSVIHRPDLSKRLILTRDKDQCLSDQRAVSVKPPVGPNAERLPQSLSHLSVEIVEALLVLVKPPDSLAEDPLLFYRLSGFGSGRNSRSSILRRHRRALQFGAQSVFYVFSNPEALLQSFRLPLQETAVSDNGTVSVHNVHPLQIDQAIRLLKAFDESKIIFRSLWIALGALFTPSPDLSHPKSPRLKAAISCSKTRSSLSSSESGAITPVSTTPYYSDSKAVHIMTLCLAALVAAVPQASAQTMLAVRKLRASGRVAPDANVLATNAERIKSLLEVTDALEDDLALRLMSRLTQAIAARCCAAEIIKNKQKRTSSYTGQDGHSPDLLQLLREYLKQSRCENHTTKSEEAGSSSRLAYGWSMPAIAVEWLRSVLLKEWNGRAEVQRWGAVGGAVMILASLYAQHEELGLSPEVFHTPFLSERLDPMDTPVDWLAASQSSKTIHLLSYPFLFPPSALVTYFRAVNYSSMSKAYESSMTTSRQVLHLAFAGDQNEGRLYNRLKTAMSTNLVLEVRRDNVLRDALNQLWRRERRELIRPLKVRMGMDEGEEGIDHGGVQQEFFRMAIGEALNPDYGLFTTDTRTSMSWFQPRPFEPAYKFELLGLLTSLAVYNGLTLPITFPKALYRKLLGLPVTELDHIRDGWPDLARGLSDLLTWANGEVEEVFMRTYEFTIDTPGSTLSVDMQRIGREDSWPLGYNPRSRSKAKSASFEDARAPGIFSIGEGSEPLRPSTTLDMNIAAKKSDVDHDQEEYGESCAQEPHLQRPKLTTPDASMVNNANREQYVKDYIFWLTDKSIRSQYEAFARGFYTCLDRKALSIFNSEALQSVVEGIQEIDIDTLERTARYDDGYSASHRTIKDFWHVVRQYTPEKRRQLLEFVTASDRVPVNGISTILFVIQRNGTDDNRVPTSLTCFGRLLLPEYSTRKKLKEKLRVAIENSKGFGVQ